MAYQVQEIPVIPKSQQLTIAIGSVIYNLRILWRGNVYVLDILDSTNQPIVQGIPLVNGLNLLEQFTYLGIFGEWVILSDVPYTDPTYDTLGTVTHFCVVSEV